MFQVCGKLTDSVSGGKCSGHPEASPVSRASTQNCQSRFKSIRLEAKTETDTRNNRIVSWTLRFMRPLKKTKHRDLNKCWPHNAQSASFGSLTRASVSRYARLWLVMNAVVAKCSDPEVVVIALGSLPLSELARILLK